MKINIKWSPYTSHHFGNRVLKQIFFHDRPWISPWINSISNELDMTIHVIASQLSGYCDVINNRVWRHQQSVKLASEARDRCVKIPNSCIWLGYLSLCFDENLLMTMCYHGIMTWQAVVLLVSGGVSWHPSVEAFVWQVMAGFISMAVPDLHMVYQILK